MSEFEKAILEELRSLNSKIGGLEEGQKETLSRMDALGEGQKETLSRMDALEEGQKEDRKVLDLVATQVSILTKDVNDLKEGQKRLEHAQSKTEIVLEHDIRNQLQVLFDGQKQQGDQLNRIEEEVKKHDEVILRRIK